MRLRGQNLVYAVTFCCSIGFLLFGYDLGFMGGLTTSPEFLSVFNNPSSSLLAFLVASYDVGCLIGALFQFTLGDRFGRKQSNIAGAVVVCVGAILQTTTFGLAQFLVGRIVAGFGLGTMTTVIPIYLSECEFFFLFFFFFFYWCYCCYYYVGFLLVEGSMNMT